MLIHPALVRWDYYEKIQALLQDQYHLIIPALPGYDAETTNENFTSIETIANQLEQWLTNHHIQTIDLLYGCSMGGSIALKMFSNQQVTIKNLICDGAITPYQLPWLLTRLIAIKDFLLIASGKIGGQKLLQKAFATDDYTQEDLIYITKVFQTVSYKTIWRTFESCNNYTMPKQATQNKNPIQYWYGEKEAHARKSDIQYMKKYFPHTHFIKFKNSGHASMANLYPKQTVQRFKQLIESKHETTSNHSSQSQSEQ